MKYRIIQTDQNLFIVEIREWFFWRKLTRGDVAKDLVDKIWGTNRPKLFDTIHDAEVGLSEYFLRKNCSKRENKDIVCSGEIIQISDKNQPVKELNYE